jgi:hypothetical protein
MSPRDRSEFPWYRYALALLGVGLGVMAAACGNDRFIVVGTATAASTSGFVEVEDDDSAGADLLIHMEHLQPAVHVDATAKHYVVWLEAGNGAPRRAGVLSYDPDERIGELRTRSPFLDFMVKITAEPTAEPTAPSGAVVATQAVSID